MPRIVRPMYSDPTDGLPLVGSHGRCLLGVRPTGTSADIDLDPAGDVNGNVVVNRKGLSVSADWRQLPGYMIPVELEDDTNGASGKGMKVYVHGTGAFAEGVVAAALEMLLKPHSVDSGVVCPVATVSRWRLCPGGDCVFEPVSSRSSSHPSTLGGRPELNDEPIRPDHRYEFS